MAPSEAERIMALKIPGVYLRREYRRYYPTGEVTSHMLGFTNIDDRGQEGLELAHNQWLQGLPGSKKVIKDRLDRFVEEDVESIRQPEPGKKLVLSIDQRIQYLAYRALKEAYMDHRAKAATAVVLDVDTGGILAMVNQPSTNPNNRDELPKSELLRNRAVTDTFEPGSTMKPFTIAMALESGAYQPRTPINTAPGYMKFGRRRIRDVHNYGRIDVTRVVSKSSNVGTSKIALSLPAENLWKLYVQLGLGQSTGLGFTGERKGILRHFSEWNALSHANQSFGYGLTLTVLQLAQAYAVLAADGVRRPLRLLQREQPPTRETRVLSVDTARKVRAMLEEAVSIKGTGFKASVPGYRVAGKTGTSHKVANGRYIPNRYVSLFAGMVPASRPRLVMVVLVDDPRRKGHYGGTVAAPVFGKVMKGALRILNVPPDIAPSERYVMVEQTP
jgi:cell division protein FtsI (penicillin-binding protein 3)